MTRFVKAFGVGMISIWVFACSNDGFSSADAGTGGNSKPVTGSTITNTVTGVTFQMIHVSGGLTTPTGPTDAGSATVAVDYEIGKTEVTYGLWSVVYKWATGDANMNGVIDGAEVAGAYTFANVGRQGGDQTAVCTGSTGTSLNPVTCINWRDAMVWCNALTEYFNAKNKTSYAVVYTSEKTYTIPIRNSADGGFTAKTDYPNPGSFDDPYVNPDAKGFRLPTSVEWELAARYKGSDSNNGAIERPASSGQWWTPGSYASGAAADVSVFADTSTVAWFGNSILNGTGNTISTRDVKLKAANALGLVDMSGNVWEWVFDWQAAGSLRLRRGGDWSLAAKFLSINEVNLNIPPYDESNVQGFRIARTP